MYEFLKEVKAIGFDLDQTLYPNSEEIQDRVRTEISKRILDKQSSHGTITAARQHFEKRYLELQSGTKVLKEAGYEDVERVMDDCLARADILDLIKRNEKLARILDRIADRYSSLFLITGSPEDLALKKLKRLGIAPEIFEIKIYSTTQNAGTKNTGEAFQYYLSISHVIPQNNLYIGDRLKSDILPAKKLGMHVGAVWSEIPEADFSIPSINDLKGVLL